MMVPVAETFNLEKAVCNHGFFMMAPNRWMSSKKSLMRPLRLDDNSSSVTVSITQPRNKNFLLIALLHHQTLLPLSSEQQHVIQGQVRRMLRISAKDEMMVEEFHRAHPKAKKVGFARIFRSPSLFEDIIKSILLCCSPWARSLEMARALCDLQQKFFSSTGKKSTRKRKRSSVDDSIECELMGNFPSPKEIACLDDKSLNKHCNLGYRASIILQVARSIDNGSLNLDDFERQMSPELLRQRLLTIKGFGPFTVANVMMCIGFYQEIPVDTETIKHLEEVHGRAKLNKTTAAEVIAQVYDKYAPFQCLAYWMEHLEYYETRLGKLSELPHSQYCNVTTTKFERMGGS